MTPKEITIDGVGYVLTPKETEKKPLFTTEDGKPAYDGDNVFLLSEHSWLIAECKAPISPFRGAINELKYFSTKEAAEQWIADNKPMYSLNDIRETLEIEIPKWGGNKAIIDRLKRKK